MSKKQQARYIKNHISKNTKDISKAGKSKFGITNSLIIRAINNDKNAQEKIGDMGIVGQRLKTAIPTIKEQLQTYIEGTTEYNQALAELAKSIGDGASKISKAGMDAELANDRYNQAMSEYWDSFNNSKESARIKHQNKMELQEMKAWIDSLITETNHQAALESTTNRPKEQQRIADKQYETDLMMERLNYGSDADITLIPKKHYTNNVFVKVWNGIRDIFD